MAETQPKQPKPPKTPSTTEMLTTPIAPIPQVDDAGNALQFEHLKKMFEMIYSKDDVEVKTDINSPQIIALTKGKIFADRYNCSIMQSLCQNIMTLSISKNRQSRKEFTEISKSMNASPMVEAEPPSIRQRLIGS